MPQMTRRGNDIVPVTRHRVYRPLRLFKPAQESYILPMEQLPIAVVYRHDD